MESKREREIEQCGETVLNQKKAVKNKIKTWTGLELERGSDKVNIV